jgi:hypothetical protein
MAREDSGDFGYGPVLRAMYAALMSLVNSGLIRADEARRMVIPTVGRTRVEFAAPFVQDDHFAGLSIEHLDVFDGDDRIWADFERSRDAPAFGAQWAAFCRASVFPTLAAQLAGGLTDPRAGRFFADLEAGIATRLAAAPEQMVIPLGKVVLVKGEA